MIFEIINPSDKYTLKSDSFEVACLVTLALGTGKYGLSQIDGEMEMPIFAFGGSEYLETWWQEKFGHPFTQEQSPGQEAIECFESVLIGGAQSRASFEKGLELIDDPEKRKAWRDHWHNERRSSMNDIGSRAWATAARLRQTQP